MRKTTLTDCAFWTTSFDFCWLFSALGDRFTSSDLVAEAVAVCLGADEVGFRFDSEPLYPFFLQISYEFGSSCAFSNCDAPLL